MDLEFSVEKQKLLIEYMMSCPDIYQRCQNILKSSYFDSDLQKGLDYILDYSSKYNGLPSTELIKVETGLDLKADHEIHDSEQEYTLDSIEQFCRRAAVVEAALEAPDIIETGDYGKLLKLVQESLEVGLQKDLGTNYFENPRDRLERMKQNNLIPIGLYEIDRKLYGGLNRGEVTLFTAGCVTAETKIKLIKKVKIL